jgi:DNA repair protein RadC
MKDIPVRERPREKLERKGSGALSDSELLALILRTGGPGRGVLEVCRDLMSEFSVRQLSNRSIHELEKFEGVSTVKASQIVAFGELARRSSRAEPETLECFSDVRKSVEDMKMLESEKMRCFYLNSGNELLRTEETGGRVDSVEFEPREILRPAVESGSSAMIVAHNHPSGRSAPTSQDRLATGKLIESAEKIGVELLDHVIVGTEVSSMRSKTDLWSSL